MVAAVLTVFLLLANSSRATANLYTFVILLSTAGVTVLYLVGALAAWKSATTTGARSIIMVAILFSVFALYGTGLEADLWCLVLLAAGLAIRTAVRRLSSRSPSGSIPLAEVSPAVLPE
jgi:APA family basic amino acid/polyamine antiporter